MNCANCRKEFSGSNHGFPKTNNVGHITSVVDLCSRKCRFEYRDTKSATPTKALSDRATPKTASRSRKLSPSEIKRRRRPTESQVSTAIGNKLDDRGIWNTRIQSGMIKTAGGHIVKLARPGTPDRVFAYGGFTVWIEVKRQGEKPSDEQAETIATLRENGSLAFVLDDPEHLDFVLNAIDEVKAKTFVSEAVAGHAAAGIVNREIEHAKAKRK